MDPPRHRPRPHWPARPAMPARRRPTTPLAPEAPSAETPPLRQTLRLSCRVLDCAFDDPYVYRFRGRVKDDPGLTPLQLAHHLRDFRGQRHLLNTVVGSLAQDERLHQRLESLRCQLAGRYFDQVRRRRIAWQT